MPYTKMPKWYSDALTKMGVKDTPIASKRCYFRPVDKSRTKYKTDCGHVFATPDGNNDWLYEPQRRPEKPPVWIYCQYCGSKATVLGIIPTVAATKPGGCYQMEPDDLHAPGSNTLGDYQYSTRQPR